MRRLLALFLTLGVFIVPAQAHNGMQHIMGTVAAITDTTITVKTTNKTTKAVAITSDTKYSRGSATVTLRDINVGEHVVIHATNKGNQLTAAEVKVGAMKMEGVASGMDGMKMDKK